MSLSSEWHDISFFTERVWYDGYKRDGVIDILRGAFGMAPYFLGPILQEYYKTGREGKVPEEVTNNDMGGRGHS